MPVSRKKYILVLVASAAAFALALAVALLFSGGTGSGGSLAGESPVQFSEYMSRNTAYPNPDGLLCDWIELRNTSDKPFNLSGYRLTDDVTRALYAFPVGTVLPAGGYIVVWCVADGSGPMTAPFSLRSKGGETLLLMNSANTVLDRIDTIQTRKNTSVIRKDDGTLTLSAAPTPGYPNTDEGYAAYMEAAGLGKGNLRLSEVMSAEKLICAPNGQPCDWVEIENTGAESADLSGMSLSDREGERRYVFPEGTVLAPGAFLVVWCDGEGGEYAPFRLGKQGGESVILADKNGGALDRVRLPYLPDDTSYARMDGQWVVTDSPTPGYPNTDEGRQAWIDAAGYGDCKISISEVNPKNVSGLRDADGEYHDWIELHNTGDTVVSLEGWYLSDTAEDPARWRLPAVELQPGAYLVIFASGKDRSEGELHTDFSVSAGETVTLTTPVGIPADRVTVPAVSEDASWARVNGEWAESAPTPGQ